LGEVVGGGEPEFEGDGEWVEFGDAKVWQTLLRDGCQALAIFG
jgi:hypothetical protein